MGGRDGRAKQRQTCAARTLSAVVSLALRVTKCDRLDRCQPPRSLWYDAALQVSATVVQWKNARHYICTILMSMPRMAFDWRPSLPALQLDQTDWESLHWVAAGGFATAATCRLTFHDSLDSRYRSRLTYVHSERANTAH
jgi:hypothetical protein